MVQMVKEAEKLLWYLMRINSVLTKLMVPEAGSAMQKEYYLV